MVRGARYAYVALAWAFLAGVVLQVFFIGLGLFVGADYRQLHADFGWTILHLAPLIILVATGDQQGGEQPGSAVPTSESFVHRRHPTGPLKT